MRAIRTSLALVATATGLLCQTDAVIELTNRAVQLQQSGDYEKAAAAYRELVKLRPQEVAAHVNLGVVLVNLGQFNEALEEYRTALLLDPGDARIELNEALAYKKSSHLDEAVASFDKLHASFPEDIKITMLLADCFLEQAKNDQVVDLLSPLASRDPNDQGLNYMLGTALMRQHKLSEAQVYLDKILGSGETVQGHYLMATRMFESQDFPAAVEEFARAIRLDPALPGLQSYYGQALLATGDADGATAAFRTELKGNPNDFASNLALGKILTVRKNYPEAEAYLEKAVSLQPQSAEAHLALGETLSGLSRPAAARPHLELATKALPDSLEAHQALLKTYRNESVQSEAADKEQAIADKLQKQEQAATPGPKLDGPAPEFSLPEVESGSIVKLAELRRGRGAVVVFGSYSCPNFRSAAEPLKTLQKRYDGRVPFVLVYIREAHARGSWQSTRNEPGTMDYNEAATLSERRVHAAACTRSMHLPFRALVDGMDGAVESAYAAWPSRLFAISKEGRVLYSSRLTEIDFDAQELEQVIRKMISQ